MDVRVILDIVPRRIEPVDWAELYDDVHNLLAAHPARLLGYDWTTIAGVPLPVCTRAIERDRDDPMARRLCVAGERATLTTGEPHTIYRDLGRYLAPAPEQVPALTDILFAVATPAASEPIARALPAHPVPSPGCAPHAGHRSADARSRDGLARVLGDATSEASYALPLLAAAMVVEARFPRWAMVHGDFTREQAEGARRWAEIVLGRPIALPVRVEAWRLAERLGARMEGQALVTAVERLYLAPPDTKDATLLGIFGRTEAEPWWLGKLREYVDPGDAGAQRLLAAYLEAARDLDRLCGLACLDARGPRYAPEALMAALASLRSRHGTLGRGGDDAAIEKAITRVFSAGAGRLIEVLRRGDKAASEPPASETPASEPPAQASVIAELDGLAALPSPSDLTPAQREHIHALVGALRGRTDTLPSEAAPLHTIATQLARSGPTLTEDAWDWIAAAQDAELLGFIAALAALDDVGAELGSVRRALFENRELCHFARRLRLGGLT